VVIDETTALERIRQFQLPKLQIGVVGSLGGGGGSGFVGTLGVAVQTSNATDLSDLSGFAVFVGGSVGEAAGVGADVSVARTSDGRVIFAPSVGVSAGFRITPFPVAPAEVHGGLSHSSTVVVFDTDHLEDLLATMGLEYLVPTPGPR